MGYAEVTSLPEVRASRQTAELRRTLHERFDQWLDELERQVPEPASTLAALSQAVWDVRHQFTGMVLQTLVEHRYRDETMRRRIDCAHCQRTLAARPRVRCTLETLVGTLTLERPYFYCPTCRRGHYPLDAILALAPGRLQWDVQQAATALAVDLPYEAAHTHFTQLTGVHIGTERLHTLSHRAAEGLGVLDVVPDAHDIAHRVAAIASKQCPRPVLVLAIDGAHVPTRPEEARGRRPGQRHSRARRARWTGQWREAKGCRLYLLDGDRIVHVLSWHQIQNDQELAEALTQIQAAGLIPAKHVRLCVVADGAPWIWKHVQAVFPAAQEVLDYYHAAAHVHAVAKEHYGDSLHALEWAEATLTRLFDGQIGQVLGGLKRMQPVSPTDAKGIANLHAYLTAHRHRVDYGRLRHQGYPLGSGGIESANKFICHVRLKRSGAWWYVPNSNQMLALRCAKYNGTFDRVFARYRQRLRAA